MAVIQTSTWEQIKVRQECNQMKREEKKLSLLSKLCKTYMYSEPQSIRNLRLLFKGSQIKNRALKCLSSQIIYQFPQVLVDVDLVSVVVVDGWKSEIEKVVIMVQRTQLEQGDNGTVVVVPFPLFILE